MNIKQPFLLALLLTLGACVGGDPYVDRPYAIKRDMEGFPDGPPVVAGTQFTVCYSKSDATPEQIRALAEEECARGQLDPFLIEQTLSICPLSTPVAAVFRCAETVAGGAARTAGTAAQRAPSVPAFEAPRPAGAGRALGSIDANDVSTTAKSQPFPTYLFNPTPSTQ